jgi:hypothetical protein
MAEYDYREAGREAGKRGTVIELNSLQTAEDAGDEKDELLGEPIQPASRTTEKNKSRKTCGKGIIRGETLI